MPAKRLSMRKIKEVLRLKWSKRLSNRRIASSCGIARPTVSEYLRRGGVGRVDLAAAGQPGRHPPGTIAVPATAAFARPSPRHP